MGKEETELIRKQFYDLQKVLKFVENYLKNTNKERVQFKRDEINGKERLTCLDKSTTGCIKNKII